MRFKNYIFLTVFVCPFVLLPAATAFLGVGTQQLPPWSDMKSNMPRGVGLEVLEIVPESAASKVLRSGDVLEKLNEQWLVNPDQLAVLVNMQKPGDEFVVTFVREGVRKQEKLTLGDRPLRAEARRPSSPSSMQPLPGGMPGWGMAALPGLPPEVEERFREMEMQMEEMQRQFGLRTAPGHGAPGHGAAQSFQTRSRMWIDGETRIEYREENGKAEVIIQERGVQKFKGPVSMVEDFQKVPEEFRAFLIEKGVAPANESTEDMSL